MCVTIQAFVSGELVAVLQSYSDKVLSSWVERVEELLSKVATGHWVDDIWNVTGQPRITILLDRTNIIDERADDRDIVVEYPNGTMTEGLLPRTFRGHTTRPVLMVAND